VSAIGNGDADVGTEAGLAGKFSICAGRRVGLKDRVGVAGGPCGSVFWENSVDACRSEPGGSAASSVAGFACCVAVICRFVLVHKDREMP